jgi:hypothetical protein
VFVNQYPLAALKDGERTQKVVVDRPLKLDARENIRIMITPSSGSPWIHVNGSLDNDVRPPTPGATHSPERLHRPFAFAAVNGKPAWVYLSSVPAGNYTVQFDASWQDPKTPATMELRVEQSVPHPFKMLLTLMILGAVPLVVALYQLYFESRRWHDNNVS